jgi:GT2 family glycosyltransferase
MMQTGSKTPAPEDSAPVVSVIVPSWNSRRFLEPCLDSVEAQERPAAELLVVDNGSRDGTRELLERRGIDHLALDRNLGFAAAVNIGIRRTSAPFVLVLNVDAVLEEGSLKRLVDALRSEPGLGGVQPRILQAGAGRARIYSAGQCLLRDGRAIELGAGELDGPRYRRPGEVFGVCGAACLLRRELLSELGGYDERYFAFCEDVDLNARAQIMGWRFRYVPEAAVTHVGNSVWRENADRPTAFNARLVARNRLATDVKVMPPSCFPRIVLAELGSVAWSVARGRARPTLAGKLSAIRWLPRLLLERRELARRGDRKRLERWLTTDPWVSWAALSPVTARRRPG